MALKFKVIKSREQYDEYCKVLEELVFSEGDQDEIDLLTLLIETYDHELNSFDTLDPIELLKSLMNQHQMKSKDLAELLGVSKGLVSDILNYKKGLSKEVIRKLAEHFKLNQEAFNRPYRSKINTSVSA
ncbi:MAG: helix-turn-helix domain-containing protein [Bacteroidota bacterium]